MGLYGALIVRPAGFPGRAYSDARPAVRPDARVPPAAPRHGPGPPSRRGEGTAYDVTQKHDRYWTINGRSFPDTIAANNVDLAPETAVRRAGAGQAVPPGNRCRR